MSASAPIKVRHSDLASHSHQPQPSGNHKAHPPKRRKAGVSYGPLIAIAILLLILAVGGTLAHKKQSRENARIALKIESITREATAVAESTIDTLAAIREQCTGWEPEQAKLKKMVEAVLGHPLEQPLETQKPDAAKAGMTTSQTESDEDVPYGMLSRAQLDARRAAAQRTTPVDNGTTSSTSMPAAPRRFTKLYNDLEDQIEPLVRAPTQAGELEALIKEDLSLLRNQRRLELAMRKEQAITQYSERAKQLLADATAARSAFDTLARTIADAHDAHLKAEAEARAREEELQRQKAYEQTLAKEKAAIKETRKAVEQLWETMFYKKAAEEADTLLASITIEGLKPHALLLRDQAQALQELKNFLIAAMQKSPIQWGWRQSGGARHITGATDEAISFTGGSCPWPEVQRAQLGFIVKQYLGSPKTPPSLQVRFAAALGLFFNFSMNDPKKARFYAQRGCEARSESTQDIKRLTPFLEL